MCLDAQGGIKGKRQQSLWLVLSCSHVSWTWSERCVVVHILSGVGTQKLTRRAEKTESVQSVLAEVRLILALFSSVENSTGTAARPQRKSFEMI